MSTKYNNVKLYTSLASGSVFITKNTTRLANMLIAHGIPFEEIDITVNIQDKEYLHTHSKARNPRALPQVFMDGNYIGDFDTLNEANECGTFNELFDAQL
uniref:SH3 domain-binding glutamic acid-rich-like protein 2 n=1 Tax=Lygus hesperus TaxID=30085 RepID=A0A0A9XGQ0_LYGHE